MPTELFNDSGRVYFSVEYDPTNHWTVCTWLGEQNVNTVLLGADASLAILGQHACCCLLNDNRQITGAWSNEVMEGLLLSWAPQAIRAGLTHVATIAYPDSVSAVYEEVMQLSLAGRLHMRLFHSLLPAQQWLRASQAPGADR